jgi:hypothetical protein
LEIKSDYEYKDVRHPEIGALLELLIDQEVRIENMSVVDIQSEGGGAPANIQSAADQTGGAA